MVQKKILSIFVVSLLSINTLAQVKFKTTTTVTLPNTPEELAKGDFNNDGLIDFVSANFNNLLDKQVTILLNKGSGTFVSADVKNFASATNALDVAVGDFNEDNKLDVVTCSQSSNNFSLLLGDGTGNLGAPNHFSAGDLPQGIAVADMNKDGNLDVVVSNRGTPSDVYIFLGNGDATFNAPTILSIPNVWDIALADFNGDTNTDFAVSISSPATAQVWLGNGSGTSFTLNTTIAGFAGSEDILAVNLDSDADIDIIAGGGYSLNNGDATFAARIQLPQTNYEYTTGDINKDGHVDIIANDRNSNYTNMRVFLGDGTGSFNFLAKFETTILFGGVEITDINNDSNPDVVGVGFWGGVYVADALLGDGTGYFSAVTKYPVATDPRGMVKGDFNKDGLPDIALAHSIGNFIDIYLGQGQGRFKQPTATYPTGNFPSELLTFDYNKDNNTDLVTFNFTTPSVTVLTGEGTGSFTPLTTINLTANSRGIALADFNNDTFTDIAIAGGTNNAIYLLTGTGIGFNAPTTIPMSGVVEDIEAADFNNDNSMDLGAAFSGPDNFLALTGNGNGGFSEGTKFSVTGTGAPGNIKVFDFNNDGRPDVAVSGSNTEEYFFTNNGTGSFTSFKLPVTSGSSLGKDFADMDGDGIKDIIFGAQNSGSSEPGSIRAFKGVGDGTFTTSLFFKQYSGGNLITTHDFDGDGKIDIASTSFNIYEDYIGVLINATEPACVSPSGSLTTSSTVCVGQQVTLTATASGTEPFSYQWKKEGNTISGATASTLNFSSVTAADAGNYTCVITNSCGNTTTAPSVLTVQTSLTPPTATGSSSCIPASLTLSASGGVNGGYRWYDVPTGGSALPGEVNDTYVSPVVTTTTTYYVSLYNGTCESARTPVVATIAPLTKPVVTSTVPPLSGVVSICEGESVILTGPDGFAVYTWSKGETTQQVTVNSTESYSLIVEDAGGCVSPASDVVKILVHPYPETTITVNGTQLTASPGDLYQWYLNNIAIAGATDQTFEFNVLEFGVYTVDVTDNGCTSSSDEFVYLITENETIHKGWEIYPNPFTTEISIQSPSSGKMKIEIIDVLGRSVKKISETDSAIIPLNELNNGAYLLRIHTANQILHFRITKTQ